MSMKNYSDTLGNWTRNPSACNALPRLTAPSRTPHKIVFLINLKVIFMQNKMCNSIVHSQAVIVGDEVVG